MHKHLTRLSQTWSSLPIYFITACTYRRKPFLACKQNAEIMIDEWKSSYDRLGWQVGRYVIMPDHVHFFCTFVGQLTESSRDVLSIFMQHWKQWTSKRIIRASKNSPNEILPPVWQKEFFDHLLRSDDSYNQKWLYVLDNPVRKKLIVKPEDWPWQGEIFEL